MISMHAYLDDFNKITVRVSKNFYNGNTSKFTISNTSGEIVECSINGIENHTNSIYYHISPMADLKFGVMYQIREAHGLAVPLEIRHVVHSEKFDEMFAYEKDDLGALYTAEYTDFRVWAPTAYGASLKLETKQGCVLLPMERGEYGVYYVRAWGDHSETLYTYLIERDGQVVESIDPYGISTTANGMKSAVIDTAKILSIPDPGVSSPINSAVDAIIYECSVRDMTSSVLTGTSTNRKFISLTEHGTSYKGMPTGLDYLQSLGVTHVQFQPVMDFATVDEMNSLSGYNWGYDPAQLMALEGSYSTNPMDPYARVTEFRKMIAALHECGLRVTLDLVFNHMYNEETSAMGRIVPFYYFRYNSNGVSSNGSFCGNDLDSRRKMARHLFIHIIKAYIRLYGVDGYRFDLMGILDIETMNQIRAAAISLKKDALIYGEGWDLPTALEGREKSTILNQHRLPGIGHFNDYFRDVTKGRTSDDQKYDRGYLTGNGHHINEMFSALAGNCLSDPYFRRFDSPQQSINGVETHDNGTSWDKMHYCCSEETREIRRKRQKMMILTTMCAQGVPFLHQGIEFCGTKRDDFNSYIAGDEINGMNWERMLMYSDVLEYTKRCIALRKKYKAFRLEDEPSIRKAVRFENKDGAAVYHIDYPENGMKGLTVLFNPYEGDRQITLNDESRVLFNENGNEDSVWSKNVNIPSYSAVVVERKEL